MQVLMISLTLGMTFLNISCAGKPVTLVQFDVRHNQGNVKRIDKVDQKTCTFQETKLPPIPLMTSPGQINKSLDAGVWVSKDDFFRLYEAWLRDCRNNMIEVQRHEQ